MNKIHYTRSKCVGCGVCEMLAPQIWVMNSNDGKADLLDSDTLARKYREIWPEEEDAVKEIVKSCPEKAIIII